MSRVEQVQVPHRATELAALRRVDYADAFVAQVATQRSPEAWVRLATERMPRLFAVVRAAHRVLGLKLEPADAPGHLIGWDILRSTDHEAVLGTAGSLGGPRIVGLTSPGTIMIATLITLKDARARALWTVFAPLHRAVARHALRTMSELDLSTSHDGSANRSSPIGSTSPSNTRVSRHRSR